jgi:hypothetical protein
VADGEDPDDPVANNFRDVRRATPDTSCRFASEKSKSGALLMPVGLPPRDVENKGEYANHYHRRDNRHETPPSMRPVMEIFSS